MDENPTSSYWQRAASDARRAAQDNLRLAGHRGIEVERLNVQLKLAQGQINRIVDLLNEGRRETTPEAQAAYLEKIAASLGLARYVRPGADKPLNEMSWSEWAEATNYEEVGDDPLDTHTQVMS